MRKKKRLFGTLSVFALLIAVTIYISLTNGAFDMTVGEVVGTLLHINDDPRFELIIFDFRLPRIVIAALVGMGLGVAGTVIQGITRNGLADSGILGINAGAGAAIVIFMFFFQGQISELGTMGIMLQPLFGLAGGLIAALTIYFFSFKGGRLDTERLLLTGIAIGSGFGALSLYLSLKMKSADFEMATVWISGSIYNANWIYILSMLPWLLILVPVVFRKAHLLDLLQLEEATVTSIGVKVEREKSIMLLASIGIISSCVSVSGSISFIGLMAPHIARGLVGTRHRSIIPVSGAVGMLLVLIADFIAKTAFAPNEIPVGIVVSIIGVPYFLYLLVKRKQ